MNNPTVTFFCNAIKVLEKQYPGRLVGKDNSLEELRKHLGEVEEIYKNLPVKK